jgi:hypothetical protein
MPRLKDLTGQIYGRLTVLHRVPFIRSNGKTRTIWKVVCVCGNEKDVDAQYLVDGQIASCGCVKHASGPESRHFRGYGEISKSVWSDITRDYSGDLGRARSKRRLTLRFDVTIEEAWNLFLKQNRKCALSGVEISFTFTRKRRSDRTASLDRIDSTGHYTINNVQWVHKTVNLMKQSLSSQDFIDFCCEVAKQNGYSKL